jgi:hypothetical protein
MTNIGCVQACTVSSNNRDHGGTKQTFQPPSHARSPSVVEGKSMRWLLRYARHCDVQFDPHQSEATALKGYFTQGAWRLVCRSARVSFIPVLRNRRLTFDNLVQYVQSLVENGFQAPPSPELLAYLIQSSYYFFDHTPEVPESTDEMTLLRLSTRHGDVGRMDFQRVHEWLHRDRGSVTTRMKWSSVLRKAKDWHLRQQLVVNRAKSDRSGHPLLLWHFACSTMAWSDYEVIPLVNEVDLWDEGQAMSSCLYQLRNLCAKGKEPSRYFSVKKDGRRHATLELVRVVPHENMHGPDRIYGRWQLQDCRLSHNRLPSDALVKILTDFGWHYNKLSQRPARMAKEPRP